MSETLEETRSPLEEAAYQKMNKTVGTGSITRVVGPVVDVQFRDQVPAIYTALVVEGETPMGEVSAVLEVESQLPHGVVRTVAMSSTDGLQRGLHARHRSTDDDACGRIHARSRLERHGSACRRQAHPR